MVGIFPTAMGIAFMSPQCITPTIGLIADQTPDHFASTNNVSIVSEFDQEIPQSQTADNPVAPRGRAAQPSRDTRKTN